jgi:hypothetical protein
MLKFLTEKKRPVSIHHELFKNNKILEYHVDFLPECAKKGHDAVLSFILIIAT